MGHTLVWGGFLVSATEAPVRGEDLGVKPPRRVPEPWVYLVALQCLSGAVLGESQLTVPKHRIDEVGASTQYPFSCKGKEP